MYTNQHLTIEYACPAWAPTTSDSNIERLQTIQNTALRTATGHTRDTNVTHMHQETLVLPLKSHMNMISAQYRENSRDPDHPQHGALRRPPPDRQMKRTALDASHVMVVHSCDREGEQGKQRERNKKVIHTDAVQLAIDQQPPNPLI